jgi:predicted enzyme related to lactoylglutathione lyase
LRSARIVPGIADARAGRSLAVETIGAILLPEIRTAPAAARTREQAGGKRARYRCGMTITGIAFTMYPASDMARAVAFYRDVLGLTPGAIASDFWTEFDIAGGTFGIGSFEQAGKPGTAQSLALEVDDVPALRAALGERGLESSEPFETQICWISMVRDPDGNQVWLHQSKAR